MLLHVATTTAPDHTRISAEGEIDLGTVNALRTAITDAMKQGARRLVLDLDRVSYIDSSGLGTLVGAHKRLSKLGGTLVVLCGQERVLRLFRITGLDAVLAVERPVDEAEAAPA